MITEASAKIDVKEKKVVDKKMPVFYNPDMKLNRDLSVLLLNCIDNKDMDITDVLAGSGIRSIRFMNELKKGKIKRLFVNDAKDDFFKILDQQLKINKIKDTLKLNSVSKIKKYFDDEKYDNKIIITNEDANLFLMLSKGFDYIDVDPFGSPNVFLDMAVKRIKQDGILAITATDTAPLSGTYRNACIRKYWSEPLNNELMHEVGIRILLRKVQLVAGQYEKALEPIFCFWNKHYFRIFLRCLKGKKKVDEIMKQHGFIGDCGPVWLGRLWDSKLVSSMMKNNTIKEDESLLRTISFESKIDTVGFFDYHRFAEKNKINVKHTNEYLLKKIQSKGYKAAITHFCNWGIRTDMPEKEFLKIIK